MKKLDLPLIQGDHGSLSYGGHQAWYDDRPARQAGCGSVAAANSLAILALRDENAARMLDIPFSRGAGLAEASAAHDEPAVSSPCVNQTDFKTYMDGIYRLMGGGIQLRPLKKPAGITINRYVRSVLQYGLTKGLFLIPHICLTPYCSFETAKSFLDDALEAGQAVTCGLSWNSVDARFENEKKPSVRPIRNHYVTITGLTETDDGDFILTISTWGQKATIRLSDLVASWQSPKAVDTALVYFTADGTPRSTKKAYRRAAWLVLRTLLRVPLHVFAGPF